MFIKYLKMTLTMVIVCFFGIIAFVHARPTGEYLMQTNDIQKSIDPKVTNNPINQNLILPVST